MEPTPAKAPGGNGGASITRADAVLIGRAIRAGWDIPPETRAKALEAMAALLETGTAREKTAAARVLIAADTVNAKREVAESKTRPPFEANQSADGNDQLEALRLLRAIMQDPNASQRDRILASREYSKALARNKEGQEADLAGLAEQVIQLAKDAGLEMAGWRPLPKLLSQAPEAGNAATG